MPELLQQHVPKVFFQDSLHDYDGVASELKIIRPYLTEESIVLFHDFVEENVRSAAGDVLEGFALYRIAGDDPQQLGIALWDVEVAP